MARACFSTKMVDTLVEIYVDFGMWGVNEEIKQHKKDYGLDGDDTRYLRKLVKIAIKESLC